MSERKAMSECMPLFRGQEWDEGLPKSTKGRGLIDGLFVEPKEAVGGYRSCAPDICFGHHLNGTLTFNHQDHEHRKS